MRQGALEAQLGMRILVMDGAMGSLIQRLGLGESDFRGRLGDDAPPQLGNNDLLVLSKPKAVLDIHHQYLEAGADIVETCSFGATALAQAQFGTQHLVREMNREAAWLARRAAQEWSRPDRPRFVAGSMGPTNATLSLSQDVDEPAARSLSFERVAQAYAVQVKGLLEGGVDLLAIETVFDTLVAKAALLACERSFTELGRRVPLLISATVSDRSGRTLSGQTLEAFWTSVAHARPLLAGLNCGLGAERLRARLQELAAVCPARICVYPNAGLPDSSGHFHEQPADTARLLGELAREGLADVVGGCCGTTPEHVRAISKTVEGLEPRGRRPVAARPVFSGLERLEVREDSNFLMVGERCNVMGSRRFARLIREGDFQAALQVARRQVRRGANILDICMDDALIDGPAAMQTFLRLLASEPELARLPVMIDSSHWPVVVAGLRNLQGKGIVNSISLEDGEPAFLRRARQLQRYGAAVAVMAFDEQGQAETRDSKVRILQRAYRLLCERADFDPTDIILDPGVLAVATGMEEHRRHALDFIDAVRQLKQRCPGALCSAGVSNLSFSFRGNDLVRGAMHAAFLCHAIEAGLDMAIVDAGQLAVYEEIPAPLLQRVEDVLLDRRPDATERLVELAGQLRGRRQRAEREEAWRDAPVEERLSQALLRGIEEHAGQDALEAMEALGSALAVVQGPLMAGMDRVGAQFQRGKMFLPQVVKSARVMKRAVAALEPHMAVEEAGAGRGRVLLATVRGDVHDLGKNIVSVVLACSGFQVTDLGVMAPLDAILEQAQQRQADVVGLSGLIAPSLGQMTEVAREMERRGMKQPLLVGGAATSAVHAALRIAPEYGAGVHHVRDASQAPGVVARLTDPLNRVALDADNRRRQRALREAHLQGRRPLLPFAKARARGLRLAWDVPSAPAPLGPGRLRQLEVSLNALLPLIDWRFFFGLWGLRGAFPALLDHPRRGPEARRLYADARQLLNEIVRDRLLRARACYAIWPAASQGETIVIYDGERRQRELARFPMLRQQRAPKGQEPALCLADFVAPADAGVADHVAGFAVTAGLGVQELAQAARDDGDDYRAIMVQALADRLAQAGAEWLHLQMRRTWGFGEGGQPEPAELLAGRYTGVRPALGYPACPDHSLKSELFQLLQAERIGLSLSESAAMLPTASIAGFVLAHPWARYFSVGRVGRDQVRAYAEARGKALEEVEAWLEPWLDYR